MWETLTLYYYKKLLIEKEAGVSWGGHIYEVNTLLQNWVITDFTVVRQTTLEIKDRITSNLWHGYTKMNVYA